MREKEAVPTLLLCSAIDMVHLHTEPIGSGGERDGLICCNTTQEKDTNTKTTQLCF